MSDFIRQKMLKDRNTFAIANKSKIVIAFITEVLLSIYQIKKLINIFFQHIGTYWISIAYMMDDD